jgi:Transglycosylase SLT domain
VVAIAEPKSQGQPGIVPVPLVPHASAGPIPLLAWEAYHRAAAGSGCKLPWYLLAGVGKIESNHGRYGGAQFDITGTVHPSIFGPPTAYGRAMGPMQFIPPTWASYAADGNSDDITNPQNIFDATKAAAHYLCKAGGSDLSGLVAQRRAVFAYNHLDSYVADVLAFATAYQHGEPEKVVHLVPIVYPKPAAKELATTPSTRSASSSSGVSPVSATAGPTPTTPTITPSVTPTSPTSTTAPPITPTCATTPSTASTSALATTAAGPAKTSAVPAKTSAVPAKTSAVPAKTSGSTSAVPMLTTPAPADSTTSPSSTSTTCPPCPTPTSSPSLSPTSAPSASVTACPTTAAPTTTAAAAKSTPRSTPKS